MRDPNGIYLPSDVYGEFIRVMALAKTKGARVERPQAEGEPWIVRQNGKVVARCATMDEARSELEWMPDR